MLYSEIIAVCSQIHTKHINTLCGQNVECRTFRAENTLRLGYKNQPVNAVQWNNSCLFSDLHKSHKHSCGQGVESLHVEPGGMQNKHESWNSKLIRTTHIKPQLIFSITETCYEWCHSNFS